MTTPTFQPSAAHRVMADWLFRAERELRLAFEEVQRFGSNEARARYAKAKANLDMANDAATRLSRTSAPR